MVSFVEKRPRAVLFQQVDRDTKDDAMMHTPRKTSLLQMHHVLREQPYQAILVLVLDVRLSYLVTLQQW